MIELPGQMRPVPAAASQLTGVTVLPDLVLSSDAWIECFGPKFLQAERWRVAAMDAALDHVRKAMQ